MRNTIESNLPYWVQQHIKFYCDCGAPIEDNSDIGPLTARRCSNPKCPYHMQHKVVTCLRYFGYKGIGPKTILKQLLINEPDNHLEAFVDYVDGKRFSVPLSVYVTLAQLEGYGAESAKKELDSYKNMQDYYNNCPEPNPILLQNKDFLLKCEKYFEIQPPKSKLKMYVMGSGSYHGFPNRDSYFAAINQNFGDTIHVIEVGARRSNVHYLIIEDDATPHTKSKIAKECNIPVVSPKDFVAVLTGIEAYLNEKRCNS